MLGTSQSLSVPSLRGLSLAIYKDLIISFCVWSCHTITTNVYNFRTNFLYRFFYIIALLEHRHSFIYQLYFKFLVECWPKKKKNREVLNKSPLSSILPKLVISLFSELAPHIPISCVYTISLILECTFSFPFE